ncbi:MAG: hypothetical protein ACWGNV_14955, partial [Bacteroidales bacterium]
RFERRIDRQLGEMELRSRESNDVRDSLASVIEDLKRKTGQLEQQNQRIDAQLQAIQEHAEQFSEESIRYRKNLERTLWMAGTILVGLVAASFIFLLLFTLRTRWMLERLKGRVNKLRRNLSVQRKKLRRVPGIPKKAIRRITRSEVQNRVKSKYLKKK